MLEWWPGKARRAISDYPAARQIFSDVAGSEPGTKIRDSVKCSLARISDFLRETESLSEVPLPEGNDMRVPAAAAAIVELFAAHRNQAPPHWTQGVGPLAEPVFLVEAAERMKNLRTLCETQAPEPMRKRRLYAPPNFLVFA
jgi:hypothetical protein